MIRTRIQAGVLLGAAALVLAGCGSDASERTERVVACWGTAAPRPDSGVVEFTFEQHGDVVARAAGPVETAVAAEVPAGEVTRILADGELFGEVGVEDDRPALGQDDEDGAVGYYAVMGRGCPDPAPLGEAPAGG